MKNENLGELSKEELISLIEIYSKNWLAMEGVWFQAVEKRFGMDAAMDCDVEIWDRFSDIEARKIKKYLGLPDRAGIEGLRRALGFRMYKSINDDEFTVDGNKVVYRVLDCRVQTARSRKGMEWHPCKPAGVADYTSFAKVIDDRFTCRALSCYPDVTDEGCCCSWEFTLHEDE